MRTLIPPWGLLGALACSGLVGAAEPPELSPADAELSTHVPLAADRLRELSRCPLRGEGGRPWLLLLLRREPDAGWLDDNPPVAIEGADGLLEGLFADAERVADLLRRTLVMQFQPATRGF